MRKKPHILLAILITLCVTTCIIYLIRAPIYYFYVEMQPEEDLFPFELGGKWGYMDISGKIIIKPKFYGAKGFSCGRAAVLVKDNTISWGFINTKGKLVIEPHYQIPSDFVEGYAHVSYGSGDSWYINIFGKTVDLPSYIKNGRLSPGDEHKMYKGLKWFQGENRKNGYKNWLGIEVIPPKFEYASDFSDGLATVSKGTKIGYIDTKGNLVINYQYENAFPFSEGLALISDKVGEAYHFYFIDKTGRKVIDIPKGYGEPTFFYHGLARVTIDGKLAYINKKGEVVTPHY